MLPSLRSKIVLITSVILLLAIGANSFSNSLFFSSEYSNVLQSSVFVVGENLRSQLNRILKLGIRLEDITGFEEQCQETVESYDYIAHAMIVDTRGKILFHSDPSEEGRTLTDPKILDLLKTGEGGIQIITENGNEYYEVMIPVFGIHDERIGAVGMGLPVEYVSGKADGLRAQSIFIMLVSFGVATFSLIFFISLWVTRPLTKLTMAIEDMGKEGGLNRKVQIRSNDEIGKLASTFNRMTDDLKKSREKTEKYSDQMEDKVSTRTTELEKKVKEMNEARIATLNIMEDIGEANKELEDRQKQIENANRELKKLDKLKSEFMNIGAHELKTPLIPIVGYLDMMRDAKNLDESQKTQIETCLRNANRLQMLVNDILDMSKLEAGSMKFEMKKTDVLAMIKNSVVDIETEAKKQGIKVISKLPESLPKLVIDEYRITEVLANLLNNAIKYNKPNGTITVSAGHKEKKVIVRVQDTGIGISKSDMKKMFTKFFQADTSAKRKYGGTGLGLAICKSIIKHHGGDIWIESELGKGSAFIFTLPIKKQEGGNDEDTCG
ncbi:MAG: HAMP domain-containing protein [Candidatus Aenigmarchaeota archaeon]|nr:HAMP domain-containing protein [Candidatus Aenigmarchaeota archaeon]